MAISDRIAIMDAGRIAQIGTAEELYRQPASAFVAGFVGRANLLRARVKDFTPGLATSSTSMARISLLPATRPLLQVQASMR